MKRPTPISIKISVLSWSILLCLAGQTQKGPYGWAGVFVNGPYRKKWGLHLDVQLRSDEGVSQIQTLLFRPGIHYRLNDRNTLTLGYAYVPSFTRSPGIVTFTPEHRLWQQWIKQQKIRKQVLTHRIRIEERFIGSTRYRIGTGSIRSPIFSTRLRYFNRMQLPFTEKRPFVKGPYGAIQNEGFFNLSGQDRLNGRLFDQNRSYTGLGYRVSRFWDLEFGYMRRDIQSPTTIQPKHTWHAALYLRPE
jgi:hypothetical protein